MKYWLDLMIFLPGVWLVLCVVYSLFKKNDLQSIGTNTLISVIVWAVYGWVLYLFEQKVYYGEPSIHRIMDQVGLVFIQSLFVFLAVVSIHQIFKGNTKNIIKSVIALFITAIIFLIIGVIL